MLLRALSLLVVGWSALGAVEATAVPFAGPARSGALAFPADGRCTVAEAGFALVDLDRLRLAGDAEPVTALRGLWLSDGSWLPIEAVAPAAAADRILVSGPLGDFDLPLTAVRGWGETLPAPGAGDVVVLESGAYPARIGGIADGQLAFSGELGDITVPVADVLALRLGGADRPAKGLTLALTLSPDHPPLHLLPGAAPRLAAAPDVVLAAWPAGRELRVEGGRRVYLGSLTPATVKEEGAFGVVWKHTIDTDLDGEPLRLGGERQVRGLCLHSRCALTWNLGGGFTRLSARVGIADEVRPEGDCPVTLLGDGRVLWQTERLTGRDKPHDIDVVLDGVQTLEIRVEYGNRYDIGDRVAFADAYLVRK